MRILLTGASGQVGTEFRRTSRGDGEVLSPRRDELDLSDESSVRRYLRTLRPDVVVNAGAYTAVDRAEKERDLCFAVNGAAPTALAEEAAKIGALVFHLSTDYVFDGEKAGPYCEDDSTNPLGVYGASKVAGERGVVASGGRAVILRTSWVYSLHGKNFLLTMLRLAKERPELRVVEDQIGSPTSAGQIAAAIHRLIGQLARTAEVDFPGGIYHMTAQGVTSWHGFAEAIVKGAGLPVLPRVTPISTAEYPTPALRPKNSVLSNEKFAATFGFRLRPWQAELDEVLAGRAVEA
jgi:dTDP-4-dehydrorhamnose reductase